MFAKYLDVAKYVSTLPNKKPNAIQDFLQVSVADPWLVAEAAIHGETVVTMERSMLQSKKKVSLVDICDFFDVKHIEIFSFLRCWEARFVLSA